MNRSIALLMSALAVVAPLGITTPASAIIVFDPANYAQNVLTAAHTLQQINNQIQQLQHEAQMLVGQARNLTSLPYSALTQLQQSIQGTQQLLAQAQGVAYNVANIDQAFRTTYAPATASQTSQQLVGNAQARWQQSVQALQDLLRVQSGVVGNLDNNRQQTAALVTSSQGAVGALQATQAGNQLVALQVQQLADLTASVAAQARAQAFDAAQRAAAQDQAREQLRRFLTPGSGYAPTAITMFHN